MPGKADSNTHTHTQCHREPFVVKSQLPREKAELWHPLKTAYSAGTPQILERFIAHLELWQQIELCALRECKSMGVLPSELII